MLEEGCADLRHYSTCAGFMDTTMCLASIKKIHKYTSAKVQLVFWFKLVPSVGAHVNFLCLHSPTGPTTWRSVSPRCRTSSNKLRASRKGPEKQVRSAGGGPRSTFYHPRRLWNGHTSDPSIDVIFLLSKDSRKRIMHFYLLLCEETSCFSAHCLWVIANTHLFFFLSSSCVVFHHFNPKSFVSKVTRQQGWCLWGLCMRSPRSNPRMSASKWGILPWKQSSEA